MLFGWSIPIVGDLAGVFHVLAARDFHTVEVGDVTIVIVDLQQQARKFARVLNAEFAAEVNGGKATVHPFDIRLDPALNRIVVEVIA